MVEDSTKCKHCEKIILKKGKVFCNNSCAAAYNNKQRIKKTYQGCLECGKALKCNDRIYCSNKCWGIKTKRENFALIAAGDLTFHEDTYKNYLIHKHGASCMECNWKEVNKYTGNVPIQLEHIDGNSENNTLSNLKILCPNCHSLTPTWGGANKGRGRKKRQQKRKEK